MASLGGSQPPKTLQETTPSSSLHWYPCTYINKSLKNKNKKTNTPKTKPQNLSLQENSEQNPSSIPPNSLFYKTQDGSISTLWHPLASCLMVFLYRANPGSSQPSLVPLCGLPPRLHLWPGPGPVLEDYMLVSTDLAALYCRTAPRSFPPGVWTN